MLSRSEYDTDTDMNIERIQIERKQIARCLQGTKY